MLVIFLYNAPSYNKWVVIGSCAAAVIDGEIGQVRLSSYLGKYVCLFFYPKVGK